MTISLQTCFLSMENSLRRSKVILKMRKNYNTLSLRKSSLPVVDNANKKLEIRLVTWSSL
jgi:hypothetical protein